MLLLQITKQQITQLQVNYKIYNQFDISLKPRLDQFIVKRVDT